MSDWFVNLPKVELHAHLNGSIRDSTLLELARDLDEKGVIVFSDVENVILKEDRAISEGFKLFELIHKLCTDHKTVSRITKEVVEDFAAENVVYLEIRTTPKKNYEKNMTKQSYIEAVFEGLKSVSTVAVSFSCGLNGSDIVNSPSSEAHEKKIFVRLLLSIDRRETTEAAMETVKLALDMRHRGVVGIDLSGNPIIGEWKTFLPALEFAKAQGLSITLHCGEVADTEEINVMIDFQPGRIGHACYLEDEDWKKMRSLNIPVEICLTSNLKSGIVSSLDKHHFGDLYKWKHRLAICTDDCGIFSTTLSREYNMASSAFGLSKKDMFRLSRSAIHFVFADDGVKTELEKIFSSAEGRLGL